ncbi:hypothetical protein [Hamadaea tsunoensis]|uniref:hypothetical protein n=1 Tax=Hamadaea tsunoensis TaxID=53368 RepID=UPI0012FA8837|nr:hypothetical protein [Hamadaea tsunoensis]
MMRGTMGARLVLARWLAEWQSAHARTDGWLHPAARRGARLRLDSIPPLRTGLFPVRMRTSSRTGRR